MPPRLKLILAVSADGFLALGPTDDMKWTGPIDKGIFKLMTLVEQSDLEPVILFGRRTFEQMPKLAGRQIDFISRSGEGTFASRTLRIMANIHPTAWLGGGADVALSALQEGLVGQAFIFHSSEAILGGGIPFGPIRALLPQAPLTRVKFPGGPTVEVFRL